MDGKCRFCQGGVARSKSGLKVKLVGEWRTYGTKSERDVTFVVVPRCPTCKRAHLRVKVLEAIGGVCGIAVSIPVIMRIGHSGMADFPKVVLIILALCLITGMGAFFGQAIGESLLPRGVVYKSAIEKYPPIVSLIEQGWDFEHWGGP